MKIEFSPPEITEEDIAAVTEVLRSGWITTGPRVTEFEAAIAKRSGTARAVALNSATAALQCALALLGIGPGDEVITSAYTYTASASVIAHAGAIPVLVDTLPGSYFMNPAAVAAAITARTKAIISVDIGGVMADYDALRKVTRSHEVFRLYQPRPGSLQEKFAHVPIIADAAHSFGATYKGQPSGSVADFTAFSFHAVKNLTTAEGGALTWRAGLGVAEAAGVGKAGAAGAGAAGDADGAARVADGAAGVSPDENLSEAQKQSVAIHGAASTVDRTSSDAADAINAALSAEGAPVSPFAEPVATELDEILYKRARLYSLHGQDKDAIAKLQAGSWEYDVVAPLYKCNMTDIAAALGLSQLKRYDQTLARRQSLVRTYTTRLMADAMAAGYQLDILAHNDGAGSLSSGHLMMVRLIGRDDMFRRRFIEKMAERGVACNVHYKPLPMLSAYAMMGYDIGGYPNAWQQYVNQVTLPLYNTLSDEEVNYICDSFAAAYAECLEEL